MVKSDEKKKVSKGIALSLLEIGAVKLQPQHPFTWASGWQSPIYCDNRLTLSFVQVRSLIKSSLVSIIKGSFNNVQGIAGVATAGIPQGALVADSLDIPFVYVRPKPKGHGMGNLIEGKVVPSQKIVVVEDLISTGGSSIKAIDALKEAGFEIVGLVAIFSYGFQEAEENFNSRNIKVITLTNYTDLIETGVENGYINNSDIISLEAWRYNPATWSNK